MGKAFQKHSGSDIQTILIKAILYKKGETLTMVPQNTDHVMKCDLGVWYSDDKKSAFKVMERDAKSASINITFGAGGKPIFREVSIEPKEARTSAKRNKCNEKGVSVDADCSKDNLCIGLCNVCKCKDCECKNLERDCCDISEHMEPTDCECQGSSNGCICKDCQCKTLQSLEKNEDCENTVKSSNNHKEKGIKLNEYQENISAGLEHQSNSKSIHDTLYENEGKAASSCKQIEPNVQSSESKTEYKEINEQGNDRNYIEHKGNVISFVTDHAAFFIALSILNFK